MNVLNSLLNRVAEILLAPFAAMPLAGLVFWGAVAGVLMTFVFKRTSNQRALADIADHTRAQMLAVRLFRDDLAVTFVCQLQLLKLIGLRLWHSLPPTLVMMVPFVLVLIQLALRYESLPLTTGDEAMVELQLSPDAWEQCQDTSLEAPAGVTLETPGLRDQRRHSISWRIGVQAASASALRWTVGEEEVDKSLAVSDSPRQLTVVGQRRPGPGFWDQLFHPTEVAFSPSSAVRQVDVFYPHARSTPCLGMNLPWWLTFMIASILAALVARPFVGAQF